LDGHPLVSATLGIQATKVVLIPMRYGLRRVSPTLPSTLRRPDSDTIDVVVGHHLNSLRASRFRPKWLGCTLGTLVAPVLTVCAKGTATSSSVGAPVGGAEAAFRRVSITDRRGNPKAASPLVIWMDLSAAATRSVAGFVASRRCG
jgi:hypothetical protein